MISDVALDKQTPGPTVVSLASLHSGRSFTVVGVVRAGEIGKRLADMGFTKGALGTIRRKALLGDPIQIEIRGYNLSIRKSEAADIQVQEKSIK